MSKDERLYGELQPEEIEDAEISQIILTQQEFFSKEYSVLKTGTILPLRSKLIGLQPFIDEDGVLRMNGHLKYAHFLPHDVRMPIILPQKRWVTKLIVKQHHEKGHHVAGANQTLASLSNRFWIISAREEIHEWEKECSKCRRRKARTARQVMAPLPNIRFSLRAFSHCAVDFAGPFITVQGRGKRREKWYLCLFTCLSSRDVHLEMAYGLDTDSFLNAVYRMTSRCGVPEKMSDNGIFFVGAVKELRELADKFDKDKLLKSAANRGMQWNFNPASALHFGWVFECMIKSAKRAMYPILSSADVTDEDLVTAFAGAEALINSRSLTYQSAHPDDNIPLTPNHFLHGCIGGQFAPESVDKSDFHPRK
ncbi:uncharacterized protein LOC121378069 [Gigantopelta aegis]|uniref:uncharacterized protein LOC121378069 n=1 Tax=Gigantopelta aegis TaxID=1735272 RepID=UPI001B88B464|nr:uncharacterized protein LOC121378069 [Gigantopelta aegis]